MATPHQMPEAMLRPRKWIATKELSVAATNSAPLSRPQREKTYGKGQGHRWDNEQVRTQGGGTGAATCLAQAGRLGRRLPAAPRQELGRRSMPPPRRPSN